MESPAASKFDKAPESVQPERPGLGEHIFNLARLFFLELLPSLAVGIVVMLLHEMARLVGIPASSVTERTESVLRRMDTFGNFVKTRQYRNENVQTESAPSVSSLLARYEDAEDEGDHAQSETSSSRFVTPSRPNASSWVAAPTESTVSHSPSGCSQSVRSGKIHQTRGIEESESEGEDDDTSDKEERNVSEFELGKGEKHGRNTDSRRWEEDSTFGDMIDQAVEDEDDSNDENSHVHNSDEHSMHQDDDSDASLPSVHLRPKHSRFIQETPSPHVLGINLEGLSPSRHGDPWAHTRPVLRAQLKPTPMVDIDDDELEAKSPSPIEEMAMARPPRSPAYSAEPNSDSTQEDEIANYHLERESDESARNYANESQETTKDSLVASLTLDLEKLQSRTNSMDRAPNSPYAYGAADKSALVTLNQANSMPALLDKKEIGAHGKLGRVASAMSATGSTGRKISELSGLLSLRHTSDITVRRPSAYNNEQPKEVVRSISVQGSATTMDDKRFSKSSGAFSFDRWSGRLSSPREHSSPIPKRTTRKTDEKSEDSHTVGRRRLFSRHQSLRMDREGRVEIRAAVRNILRRNRGGDKTNTLREGKHTQDRDPVTGAKEVSDEQEPSYFIVEFPVELTASCLAKICRQAGYDVSIKRNSTRMKVEAPYGAGNQTLHAIVFFSRRPGMKDHTLVSVARAKEDRDRTPGKEFSALFRHLHTRSKEIRRLSSADSDGPASAGSERFQSVPRMGKEQPY